jgi:hypothetical protein
MGPRGDYRHVRALQTLTPDQLITMRWAPLCRKHLVEFDKNEHSRRKD